MNNDVRILYQAKKIYSVPKYSRISLLKQLPSYDRIHVIDTIYELESGVIDEEDLLNAIRSRQVKPAI